MEALDLPEVGHAVRVRNRLATVRAVEPSESRDAGRLGIVEVEDNGQGIVAQAKNKKRPRRLKPVPPTSWPCAWSGCWSSTRCWNPDDRPSLPSTCREFAERWRSRSVEVRRRPGDELAPFPGSSQQECSRTDWLRVDGAKAG